MYRNRMYTITKSWYTITKNDLDSAHENFPKKIPSDRTTGKNRGFGFVTFGDGEKVGPLNNQVQNPSQNSPFTSAGVGAYRLPLFPLTMDPKLHSIRSFFGGGQAAEASEKPDLTNILAAIQRR